MKVEKIGIDKIKAKFDSLKKSNFKPVESVE